MLTLEDIKSLASEIKTTIAVIPWILLFKFCSKEEQKWLSETLISFMVNGAKLYFYLDSPQKFQFAAQLIAMHLKKLTETCGELSDINLQYLLELQRQIFYFDYAQRANYIG